MPIDNRDWYRNWHKEQAENALEVKLSNSSLWCHHCKGLTVNALNLKCVDCGADWTVIYEREEK